MITFLSLSPFPTTKAYGVTLKYTHDAVVDLGMNAQIISVNKLNCRNYRLRFLNWVMEQLRHTYREKWALIGKIGFYLHRKLFQIYILSEVKIKSDDVLWLRDIRLTRSISYKIITPIVLEVHQIPSRKEVEILNSLDANVIVCPISEEVLSNLRQDCPLMELVSLPMGVPNFFFSHTNDIDKPNFALGYFGSYRSSGHLQGLEEMLKNLIELFREDSEFRVFMSGIGEEGYKVLSELAEVLGIQQQLILVKFLEHPKMPENMMNCKALILPYPEGKYFASRFPIKAMEYASLKIPILCTSTTSHRNIFDESEVWFYDYNFPDSLSTAFRKIQTSPSFASEKADLAYAKSLNFSYSSRIEKIMGHLHASNQ